MNQALHKLLELINLEKIGEYLFRGQSEDLGLRQVFGGQVVSQAIYAAKQTLTSDRAIHSFHSYFLRPGDSHEPIIYEVEILRDGNSFSARRVSAIQHGKPIFYMTASFQSQESGLEHQSSIMPEVPPPKGLLSETELAKSLSHLIPQKLYENFISHQAIEMRPVKFHNPFKGHVEGHERYVWFRANGTMPNEQHVHQYLLSYASDFNFLPTALQPHGIGFLEPNIQIATIDHSMWFHRPCRLDEWLLYAVESTSAYGARGFVRGQIYDQKGVLVASTIQEGVMRTRSESI